MKLLLLVGNEMNVLVAECKFHVNKIFKKVSELINNTKPDGLKKEAAGAEYMDKLKFHDGAKILIYRKYQMSDMYQLNFKVVSIFPVFPAIFEMRAFQVHLLFISLNE
jgi:hypothetical protein